MSLCLLFMDALWLKFPHTLSTGYQNPISIISLYSVVCTSRYLNEWCVAVYMWTWATVKTILVYSLIYEYIKLYINTIQVSSGVAREVTEKVPPTKPGKCAKDGKQPKPQPAVSLDGKRKIQIFVNLLKSF